MKKTNLEIYDPKKSYITPSLNVISPEEVQATYPAVNVSKCVITTDVDTVMMYAIEPFSAMTQRLNVDASLYETDEEVLQAMEEILNAPPEVNDEPLVEERIASALEYQNLMM